MQINHLQSPIYRLLRCLKNMTFTALVLSIAVTQSACTFFEPVTRFFSDSEEEETAAKLVDFDPELRLRTVWSIKVGNGQGKNFNELTPALDGGVIYVASANGLVLAVDSQSGDKLWQVKTGYTISGGVGAGEGLVLFGTENAVVYALDQANGNELWRAAVSSEVLSPPQINSGLVALQTIDGKLIGLEASSGERRWIYETSLPDLTIRGTNRPILTSDAVVAGFSNGTLIAVDPDSGSLNWEERIAIPQGRYDIERVIDADGDLFRSGSKVIASSYQGNLMAFDIRSGRAVWGLEASSYQGVDEGFGNIYYTSARSHIIAVRNSSDEIAWENTSLDLREVTAPKTINNYVAVGDFEGYIHFLSQIDGHFVSRVKVDGDGIRSNLLSDGNILYVFGNSGKLSALSFQ